MSLSLISFNGMRGTSLSSFQSYSCKRNILLDIMQPHSLLTVLTDGERDGLWWPVFRGTGCPIPDVTNLYLIRCNVWATVSTYVHLPRMFPPMDFPFEKWIALVFRDLLYIIFTFYTQDNQRERFRLSDWFSLRCSGSWMNYLPPVWWSNFRFMFLSENWCVCLT